MSLPAFSFSSPMNIPLSSDDTNSDDEPTVSLRPVLEAEGLCVCGGSLYVCEGDECESGQEA